MRFERILRPIIVTVALSSLAAPALAHKVNIFAYVEGDSVYTESYFNDGKKCKGSSVIAYADDGERLLDGTTDDDGLFAFPIPKRETLKVVLKASMGHQAEYLLPRAEVTGEEEQSPSVPIFTERGIPAEPDIVGALDRALAKRLAPLAEAVRRLERKQERPSLRDVIGGMGYIFGLMGLYYYFRGRSR